MKTMLITRIVLSSLFLSMNSNADVNIGISPIPPVVLGDVNICKEKVMNLQIMNLLSSTGPFTGTLRSGTWGAFTLTCVGSCTFTIPINTPVLVAQIKFKPTFTGTQGTSFWIVNHTPCWYQSHFYNSSDSIEISVRGNGLDAILNLSLIPTSIDFDTVTVCQAVQRQLILRLESSSTCFVEGTVYGSDLSQPFSMPSGDGDFTLQPGAEKTVTVRFSPSSVGVFTGSFRIWNTSTNQPSTIQYQLRGVGRTVPSPLDFNYILAAQYAKKIYLLKYQNSSFSEKTQIPSCTNASLSFIAPCGLTLINGSLYVADEGDYSNPGKVYKIKMQTEETSVLPFNSYYSNFSPHDVQYINGRLFLLRQKVAGVLGENSIIISDTNGTSPAEIFLPANMIGSPTRLVEIDDTLYVSTIDVQGSVYHSYVYLFAKNSLNDNLLQPGEVFELRRTYNTDRALIVSRGPRDSLYVWNFVIPSGQDTLFIYRNRSMRRSIAVNGGNAPFIRNLGEDRLFLARLNDICEVNKNDPQPIGLGSPAFSVGGTYMMRSTLAQQTGTIAFGNTTAYNIAGSPVASLQWGLTGTLPTSVIVSYYDQVTPPGILNGDYSHAFWEVRASGGSGFTCNATFNYDPSTLHTISSEPEIVVAKRSGGSEWQPFLSSVVNTTQKTVTVNGLSSFSEFTLTDRDYPLPIELGSFTVTLVGDKVRVAWMTMSEVNVFGFYVERGQGTSYVFEQVRGGFRAGHGTSTEPHNYLFIDSTINSPGVYHYRLKQVDLDGTEHYTSVISIEIVSLSVNNELPSAFALLQNHPNPFNPSTEIEFSVERKTDAVLRVYNIIGQAVATLFDGEAVPRKYYRIRFDADNLANGIYFYRLQAGSYVNVKKMVVLK